MVPNNAFVRLTTKACNRSVAVGVCDLSVNDHEEVLFNHYGVTNCRNNYRRFNAVSQCRLQALIVCVAKFEEVSHAKCSFGGAVSKRTTRDNIAAASGPPLNFRDDPPLRFIALFVFFLEV